MNAPEYQADSTPDEAMQPVTNATSTWVQGAVDGGDIEIVIDEEFRSQVPPLSQAEREALERSLEEEGCRDAVKVWLQPDGKSGILLDGHHRYDICRLHEIPYQVELVPLPDREAAADWIDAWQLSRRSVTPLLASVLRGRRYNRTKNRHGGHRRSSSHNENLNHRTSDRLAREHGVSRATITRDGDFASAVEKVCELDPMIMTKIGGGSVSKKRVIEAARISDENPNQAKAVLSGKKPLNGSRRKPKRDAALESPKSSKPVETRRSTGTGEEAAVIVIDPPWPLEANEQEKSNFPPKFAHSMMTIEEIRELELPVAEDCHVWLWCPQKHLQSAMTLIHEWGLTYVYTFVWRKCGAVTLPGLPGNNCDFAIYARAGDPGSLEAIDLSTCFDAPYGLHGENPALFYDAVRRVTEGRRIDMFGRTKVEGFDRWGNESPVEDSGDAQ